MSMALVSINGNAINDGSNYLAVLLEDNMLQAQTDAQYLERYQNWPVLSRKSFPKYKFGLVVAARAGSYDNLMAWFDSGQTEPVALVASEGGVQYYRMVLPETVLAQGSSALKVTLSTADPVWKAVTATTASAWNITASGQTTAITVGGTRYTEPTISLAVSAGAGWAYKRFVRVRNPVTDAALKNWPLDVTAGGLNTSTLVSGGKLQADGDDVRLTVDGADWPRWFDAATMNTASTKIWTALDFQPGIELKLGAAVASTGAVGELAFEKSSATDKALERLPNSGMILYDSEIFTYSSKNKSARKVGGVTRAQRGTSMASHSTGTVGYWIEHDIWMLYGNASATAPAQDDSRKPIIDLANSTNTSWVYTEFCDEAGLRAGSWTLTTLSSSGKKSQTYTGDSGTDADPAQVLGMEMNISTKSGKVVGESAEIVARLNIPGGIASVTSSGQKRRGGTSWPSFAGLRRSADGKKWTVMWNETTPASAATWTAWSRGSTSASNNKFVEFGLDGSLKANSAEQASFEVSGATVAHTSGGAVAVSLFGEVAQNWVDFTLENTTSGDSIELAYPLTGSAAIVIDCENMTVTAGGENIFSALRGMAGKRYWLRLLRGANTLRITGSVGTMTATISYRERRL